MAETLSPIQSATERDMKFRWGRSLRLVLFCAATMLFASLDVLAIGGNPHPDDVSMIALIVNPERYKDKRVRLYAFGVFQFEESSLYLSRLHAELMDASNELPLLDEKDHSALNGRVVRIEAVFRVDDARPRGYLDSTARIVAAEKIRKFDPAEDSP